MDEYKKMEDMEIPPNRYLVVVADAVGWDDRKKIHEYGYKNEQIEGIYSIYEEAVKVFEKISRKRKPDKTIEIRKEQLINIKWRKCDEPLTIKTTDPQGNISKRETFRYTTEYDMFYLRLARNQLSLIRKENKKWQHPLKRMLYSLRKEEGEGDEYMSKAIKLPVVDGIKPLNFAILSFNFLIS